MAIQDLHDLTSVSVSPYSPLALFSPGLPQHVDTHTYYVLQLQAHSTQILRVTTPSDFLQLEHFGSLLTPLLLKNFYVTLTSQFGHCFL